MGKEKNPLKALDEFYEEGVKKADESNNSELLKNAADKVLGHLKEIGYNATNVELLDGYYIFGMGTNSVVHFEIAETPDWNYGIWWNVENVKNNLVVGDFFAQNKYTIDKFKPSASVICHKIYVGDNEFSDYKFDSIIKYIKDEPELAFCKDYLYWDEYEYHTREEAIEEWKAFKEKYDNEEKYEKYFLEKDKQFLEDVFKDDKEHFEVVDNGDSCSPRLQVVCKLPCQDYEEGWYGFDFTEEEQKKLDQINKERESIENKYSIYLHQNFDNSLLAYNPENR